MSTPYHSTPRIPSAPHTTPFSGSTYKLPSVNSTRPPIHNPYDKFTQPEFDAWIGGITGALKRALGQEEEEPVQPDKHNATAFAHSRPHVDGDDSEVSDGYVDDSFAEIKARRAAGKGKARDPREGPGLGKGNSSNPIDLVSSDEEDAEEVELAIAGNNESENDEEDEETQSEGEYTWERGQPSSPPIQSPESLAKRRENSAEQGYGSEEDEELYDEDGAQYEEYEDNDDYDEEDGDDEGPARLPRSEIIDLYSDGEGETDEEDISDREISTSPRKIREESPEERGQQVEEREGRVQLPRSEIIDIDSNGEGETDEEELSGQLSSSLRKVREKYFEERDGQQGDNEEVSDGYDEYDEEEDEGEEDNLGTSQLLYPRDRPSIGRSQDKEYSEAIDDDEIQEIQPVEDDTSFPPKPSISPLDSKRPVDIPDPWSGPRTYAEDYYSGGDIRVPVGVKVDAHRLGSEDVDLVGGFGSDKKLDDDIVQPADEDTSFPPHEEDPEPSVDIPDPWEGPQTFAEDFYSGGPVQPHGGLVTAHYLGSMDVDHVNDLDRSVMSKAKEIDEIQPQYEDTSFPQEDKESEHTVDIPDPWAGPQTYAEDYYAGGDVRTLPGAPIDPALLSGTGDVEDDIDNFLTPGVLTPSQNDAPTDVDNDDDEENGIIEPPQTDQYVPSLATRRNMPIPEDADIIAIDDSDGDQDPNTFHEDQDDMLDDDDISLGYPEFNEVYQMKEMEEIDQLDSDDVIIPPTAQLNQEESDVAISDHQFEDEGEEKFDLEPPQDSNISVVVGQVEKEADNFQQDDDALPGLKTGEELEHPHIVETPLFEEVQDRSNLTNDDGDVAVVYPSEINEVDSSSRHLVEGDSALEITVEFDSLIGPSTESLSVKNLTERRDKKEYQDMMGPNSKEEDTTSENILAEDVDLIETEPVTNTSTYSGNLDNDEGPTVGTVLADTEILLSAIVEPAVSNEDDIRSVPGLEGGDENDSQLSVPLAVSSPTAAASNQSQILGQLPTPPSEKSRYVLLPPEVEVNVPTVESPSRKHATEIEEVPDEDAAIPQSAIEIPNEESEQATHHTSTIEYTVIEATEYVIYMDEDADGELEDEDNLEVASAYTDEVIGDDPYTVEEPRTEGRLTAEPCEREMSLGVVSLGPEETSAFDRDDDVGAAESNHASPTNESMDPVSGVEKTSSLSQASQESAGIDPSSKAIEEADIELMSDALPKQHGIPMPVTADPNVLDPTDQPPASSNLTTDISTDPIPRATLEAQAITQQNQGLSVNAPDALTQVDGLFTPAEPSVEPTEEDLNSRRILTEIAQYMFGTATSSPGGIARIPSPRESELSSLLDVPLSLRVGGPYSPTSNTATPTEDVFGKLPAASNSDRTTGRDDDRSGATSLPYRAPSNSMRVILTRKPTDPVLMADPYPYCLSTPGPALYPGQDEGSEEELGLDNSISSNSTLEKDIEGTTVDGGDGLELQYPPDTTATSGQPNSGATASQDIQKDTNLNIDRDGRQTAQGSDSGSQSNILDELPIPMSTANLLTEDPSTEVPPPLPSKRKRNNRTTIAATRKRATTSAKQPRTRKPNVDELLSPSTAESSLEGLTKGVGSAVNKRKKERKHTSSRTSSASWKKSTTQNVPETTSDETILVKPRPEGKIVESSQRATSVGSTQEGSQTSSGATITHKLLQSGTASSVVSPVPSNRPFTSQPSPTVNRPNILPHPTAASESLVHAHGQKRKAMMAQAMQQSFSPRAQSKKPQLSRFPSAPMTITGLPSSSTSATSPIAAPNSPTTTSPAGVPSSVVPEKPNTPITKANSTSSRASKFSTPVTRSHCRYHRISLPKEEGGPRVSFLVPGCSLNDKELMDEEEIVDHGDATVEDSRNMLKDIESLGFDLDLIGVLRQLVGLDILREQEVFYLPQPGEVVVRKNPLQKSASTIRAPGEASSYAGSPGGYSGSAIASPGPNRAPPSASSWSESPSISSLLRQPPIVAGKDQTETEGGSAFAETDLDTESELSDDDEEEPTAKRSRPSPPDEPGVMGPPTSQSKGKQTLKSKGNKKTDLTYEPDEDHDDEESDTPTSSQKRRKSVRGIKRSRTSDAVPIGNDSSERETKKLKSDLAAPLEPTAPQPQHPAI